MSKVFVVHQPAVRDRDTGRMRPQYDLSPALQYGEIVDVLPPGSISQDIDAVKIQIISVLLDKGCSRDDYLLALGDPIAIILGAFAMAMFTDRIQMLKWDRRTYSYMAANIKWDYQEVHNLVKDYL